MTLANKFLKNYGSVLGPLLVLHTALSYPCMKKTSCLNSSLMQCKLSKRFTPSQCFHNLCKHAFSFTLKENLKTNNIPFQVVKMFTFFFAFGRMFYRSSWLKIFRYLSCFFFGIYLVENCIITLFSWKSEQFSAVSSVFQAYPVLCLIP